jgi:hypothetical protein
MHDTKVFANTSSEVHPAVVLPLLGLLSGYYLPCLCRGKKSSQALPNVWGWVKKHSKHPDSSVIVSTAKSPPGPPWNRSKAYEVNGQWWCGCTAFVSPAVLVKPFNLKNYKNRTSLKRYTAKYLLLLQKLTGMCHCRNIRTFRFQL